MKRISSLARSSRSQGFTLVELLVVMGIIAILAGVLFSAGGAAIRAAKRAKAANTATQIQTSVLNYYTEYSVYPIPSTAAASTDYYIKDQAANAAAWADLIKALCGQINPYTGLSDTTSKVANSRAIAFLNLKKSDVDVNVGPINPMATGTAIYFNIGMDGDYDGVLGVNTTGGSIPNLSTAVIGTDPAAGGTSTAGVAVWANCNGLTTTKNPAFWVRTF